MSPEDVPGESFEATDLGMVVHFAELDGTTLLGEWGDGSNAEMSVERFTQARMSGDLRGPL